MKYQHSFTYCPVKNTRNLLLSVLITDQQRTYSFLTCIVTKLSTENGERFAAFLHEFV